MPLTLPLGPPSNIDANSTNYSSCTNYRLTKYPNTPASYIYKHDLSSAADNYDSPNISASQTKNGSPEKIPSLSIRPTLILSFNRRAVAYKINL